MKHTILRSAGTAAAALSLTLGVAACGAEDETSAAAGEAGSSASASAEAKDTSAGSEGSGKADPAARTFGPGCSAVPTDGAGSFQGMATAPVASAASANPLLKTLVSAVKQAKLVDALNSAEELTVFAPTDDAFGKIPKKDLQGVLKDKKLLTTVLTHHVVPMKLSPQELAGKHETLAGDTVTVKGSGEEFSVGDEKAQVLCGNIPTANATVYVVDTVLMP